MQGRDPDRDDGAPGQSPGPHSEPPPPEQPDQTGSSSTSDAYGATGESQGENDDAGPGDARQPQRGLFEPRRQGEQSATPPGGQSESGTTERGSYTSAESGPEPRLGQDPNQSDAASPHPGAPGTPGRAEPGTEPFSVPGQPPQHTERSTEWFSPPQQHSTRPEYEGSPGQPSGPEQPESYRSPAAGETGSDPHGSGQPEGDDDPGSQSAEPADPATESLRLAIGDPSWSPSGEPPRYSPRQGQEPPGYPPASSSPSQGPRGPHAGAPPPGEQPPGRKPASYGGPPYGDPYGRQGPSGERPAYGGASLPEESPYTTPQSGEDSPYGGRSRYGADAPPYGQSPPSQQAAPPYGQSPGGPYGQDPARPYGQGTGSPYAQGPGGPYNHGAGSPYAPGGSSTYGAGPGGPQSVAGGEAPPYGMDPFSARKPKRGRRGFVIAGLVMVVCVVLGGVAYAAFLRGDPGGTAPVAQTSDTAQDRSSEDSKPSPPPEPTFNPDKLNSTKTDPKPLALAEEFPQKNITVGGQTLHRVTQDMTKQCAKAAQPGFGKALKKARCLRVLRATFVDKDKKYAVMAGVTVLPNEKNARQVEKAAKPGENIWFAALPGPQGSGAGQIHRSGGYSAIQVVGHYVVFAFATYSDKITPGKDSADLSRLSAAMRDRATEPLVQRGMVTPSTGR